MKCEKVQKLLPSYLKGKLKEGKKAKIIAHLTDCPECRRSEEKLKISLALIGSLEGDKKPKRFKWDIYPDKLWWPTFLSSPRLRNGIIMAGLGILLVWAYQSFYQPAGKDIIPPPTKSRLSGEGQKPQAPEMTLESLPESIEETVKKLPRLVIKKSPVPPVTSAPGIKDISPKPKAKPQKKVQSAIKVLPSAPRKAEKDLPSEIPATPEVGAKSEIEKDTLPAPNTIRIEPKEEVREEKVLSLPRTKEYNRGDLYKKATQKLNEKLPDLSDF
ncbi:MAG: zf-HC2 domain-containing protein [bacterium]